VRLGAFVRRDLAASRGRLALVGSAVAVGVAVTVVLGALGVGAWRSIVVPLLPKLPLDVIRVEPRVVSLGMFALDGSALGGGLDAAQIERLRGLDGVAAVYPMIGASFPLRAEGGERLLGRGIRTDLFATGIDPALVAADVAPGHRFEDPGPDGQVVPVLVARRLLELYNTTVAPAIERPKLSEEAIIGFSAEIVLGSSYVRGTPDPSKVERRIGQIVGVSDHATLVGVTVPEATLRRWNARHGGGRDPIVGAWVRTRTPSDAGPVAAAIERAGLAVDDTLKVVGGAVAAAGLVGGLLAFVLLGLAGFAIAQTFFLLVAERRDELAALRAMGARRRDLRRLVLVEALVVGAAGGLAGVLLGVGVALGVDAALLAVVPDVPFKPSSTVAFPLWLLGGAWLLGTLSAAVGAAWPAARAAAADPAAALRA
jgi:putative ABC transport system permease protein